MVVCGHSPSMVQEEKIVFQAYVTSEPQRQAWLRAIDRVLSANSDEEEDDAFDGNVKFGVMMVRISCGIIVAGAMLRTSFQSAKRFLFNEQAQPQTKFKKRTSLLDVI